MIKFDAGALRVTILAMQNLGVTEDKAAREASRSAGAILYAAVKQNISLRDHTQADLDAKGNPYARRNGSIAIHTSGTKSLMHPAFRVHAQSGTLLSALKSGPTPTGIGWRVELDESVARHAKFVVQGTKVLLPRDVIVDTALAPAVQKRMMKDIVMTLGRKLRTQGAIRFGGGS